MRVTTASPRGARIGPHQRPAGAGVAALACTLVAQVVAFRGVRLDDAFITFRYAQNLASGVGFVFNRGSRVMGSTSPGEALLSALAYLFSDHEALPSVMAAVGCIGWTAQAALLFFFLRRSVGAFRAGFVAAGIAVGAAGSAQWVPLETNVACAAVLAAMVLGLEGRWAGAAVACALGGLMRPDALLAALPVGVLCLHELRGRAWRPAALLVALAAPWPLFAWSYFGSPLPQSAVAKYHQSTPLAYLAHVLGDVPSEVVIAPTPAVAKVLFWVLVVAGGAVLVRADRRSMILPLHGALLAIAYVVLAPDTAFVWHLYPVTLVAVALALLAVATLVETIRGAGRYALAVPLVALTAVGTVRFARRYPDDVWFGARDRIYREVAAYLATNAAPDDVVDAEEVGTLAYYADLPMNDHARLVTPFPGDVFWKLEHGKPTKLRWLVLNRKQLDAAWERKFYENRPMLAFLEPPWRIWVVDLKAPP